MRNRNLPRLKPALALAALCSALLVSVPVTAAPPDFYWESPTRLSTGVGAYPQAISTAGRVVVMWQENVPSVDGGSAWLSLASYGTDGVQRRDRFAGPLPYNGDAPVLFSAAADGNGTMVVAATSGERSVSLYESRNGGLDFAPPTVIQMTEPGVAPRIFTKTGGGWYLFVTRQQTFSRPQADGGRAEYQSLSIFYARSENGTAWTTFAPFVGGEVGLDPNFLPSAASINGTDVVVFQSLTGGARPSYQLFSVWTTDGGATWSAPHRITDFLDPVRRDRTSAGDFDNQRPHLAQVGGSLWMAWERRVLSGPAQIYAARLDASGAVVPDSVERVTLGQGSCSEPRLLDANGEPAVAWFDDRKGGSRVYIAFRSGTLWNEQDLSGKSRGDATFGRAIYTARGLYAFWQTGRGTTSSVLAMIPDTSVQSPVPVAIDFEAGAPTRRSRASIRWKSPDDSSGILGFSYLWSRDAAAEPPHRVGALENQTSASFDADQDGDWYFSIRAEDYAGNWSKTARLRFVRDTTPPGTPVPFPPAASADGFMASNSFALSWLPPPDPDVAGYTWVLEYLGPLDRPPARRLASARATAELAAGTYNLLPSTDHEQRLWSARQPASPSPAIRTTVPRADFFNIDDGFWAFSVAAIDRVGNIGLASRILLRADKFIPFTTVSDVASTRDEFGTLRLSILGRGFADNGTITSVVIDADGKEPYDRVYDQAGKGFSIVSDRLITIPEIVDLAAGTYRIGLHHQTRGWYFTGPRLSVDYTGTVKFGDRGEPWNPTWTFEPTRHFLVRLSTLFLIAALLIPALGMILSLRQVVILAGQMRAARQEAIALLGGTPMPETERKKAAENAIRRGSGLTAQFAMTISLLVIFIVLLVSIPLGAQMLGTQSEILARGLEQRARVLLESAAQGGKSYLPAKNILELSLLPNQASAIAEAQYLTITGFGASGTTNPDIVWASNDQDILKKIDGTSLVAGTSILSDSLSPRIPAMAAEIDAKANGEVGTIADAIQQLQDEGRTLAAKLDTQSQTRLEQIAASARDLEKTLGGRLSAIANASVASEPAFDPNKLGLKATEFVFYKPILFRQGRETVFYRGLVRLSVSTAPIVAEVKAARATLIRSIAIVAAIALATGIAGSFALSGLILRPLMKVVEGIKHIRDTPDKKNLADFSIDIKRKDEFAILAGTINEMTTGLVHAAAEAEFLTVGKGVQKMFIPLIQNALGEKLTTGFEETSTHSFYGYYEGAKGVSGDYFDYRPLDGQYWAFIKCDVSGKGVPAALIMVGVATIFTTSFQGWNYKKDGIKLDALTARINDFLERRGFSGLFAALVMGVYDSKTGDTYLCHAGDNIVRVYKPEQHQVVVHKLENAPAAGAISSEMFDLSAVYKQVKIRLDHGDILLLYTDGFEESSRARRGPDFKQLFEDKKIVDREGNESTHREALVEQLGEDRIKAATEAIMSRGTFSFTKEDDPLGSDLSYDFDFSRLDASPEDLVLGLAAVEKVFRLVPDPDVTEKDQVIVDTKIDAILAKCWLQYDRFCADRRPHPDPKRTEYQYYGRLKEDAQYDDLTMMLIRRK
jgi:hypothetical protein